MCKVSAEREKPRLFTYAEPPPTAGKANIAGFVTETNGNICAKAHISPMDNYPIYRINMA